MRHALRLCLCLFIFLAACGRHDDGAAPLDASAAAFDARELFHCATERPVRTNCGLAIGVEGVLVRSPGIEAETRLTVENSCVTAEVVSTLQLQFREGSAQTIPFHSAQTIRVTTGGDIVLRDVDPSGTRAKAFNPNVPCSLKISWSRVASARQIETWNALTDGLVAQIGEELVLAGMRQQIMDWYAQWIDARTHDDVAGRLRANIDQATADGNDIVAHSLAEIIQNAPRFLIEQSLDRELQNLSVLRGRGAELIRKMQDWGVSVPSAKVCTFLPGVRGCPP